MTYRRTERILFGMERGSSIKALRERLGLTQGALANALEVHPNSVARWERGELGISASMAARLEQIASSRRSGTVVARSTAVMLDPHHGAVLDALNRTLDPDVFEACAAALLRHDFPTLVPVRGGADDGFDGAVADVAGEPFPLITTTGEKLVSNLRRNLDRAKKKGWNVARVLFASPRRITPATRGKLFKATRDRGVTLVQTYDQDWFAQSLYREPVWCKRLLGVTGRPSALSLFPLTQRPLVGDAVLGREQEIRWLLEQKGDCLLTGEPGSGKTFLLRSFALQGQARFLVDSDRTQIANDLRSLRPPAVIVDDAHVNPHQITELIQIRSEVGADFRIIATSWPGFSDPVRSALQIGRAAVLDLGRLDANTVVEIIKSSGVRGPDRLLYVIRKQAAGRPGLAATLAHLCVTGSVEEVFNGESLFQELHRGFRRMIGKEALYHLAPFALGGGAGVRHESVCRTLGVSPLELRQALAKVGAAGVISQREDQAISVEPEPLRWSLVKRAFFDGPLPLEIDPFLGIVESRRDALKVLIGVRYRGVAIPELEEWLERENSSDLWSVYAALGAVEARSVLRRHPEIILEVAQSALGSAPETAIPMLLDHVNEGDVAVRDATEGRLPQIGTKSPLDHLKTWAKATSSEGQDVLQRRLSIVSATINWWKRDGSGRPAIRAFCIALLPGLEYSAVDPGIGDRMTHVSRMLHNDELAQLKAYWPEVLEVVKDTKHVPWNDLFDLLEVWIVPEATLFPPVKIDRATEETLRNFAATMITDLCECSSQHPGVQHQFGQLASRLSLSVDLNLSPDFEILCPPESIESRDWESQHQEWSNATSRLALMWKDCRVGKVGAFLKWVEDEADLAGIQHPRVSHLFCEHLAERVADPAAVVEELVRVELPSELVVPFLRRAAGGSRCSWNALAIRCLGMERYRRIAVETVLTDPTPLPKIRTEAISKAAEVSNLEEFLMGSCRSIAETTIMEMLRSKDRRTAVATAVGYWLAFRGKIPRSIGVPWRRAILRSARGVSGGKSGSHWIGEILSKDRGLAVDWLVRNLTGPRSSHSLKTLQTTRKVVGSLGPRQRRIVLARVDADRPSYILAEVMKLLIGGEPALYGQLLNSKSLVSHHLDPLNGGLDHEWRAMALAALDRGYATEEVVHATLWPASARFGPASEMWRERRLEFEALINDLDGRIAEIGRVGVQETTAWENAATVREKETAVEGHH